MAGRNPFGVALGDALMQPVKIDAPQINLPAPQAQPKMGKAQIIMGILADALAGASGRAPAFGQMLAQQRQQEQEEVKWNRRRQVERDDNRADKQWEWENKPKDAGNPYRFEDNAGNVWQLGSDGQPQRIFTDQTPKQMVHDGMMITVPNPYAAAASGTSPPATIDPSLWETGIPIGGQTPPASGGFPQARYGRPR